MSDSLSSQVSRTFLRILGNLCNDVAWMVSNCSQIFKSFSHFVNLLRIVPSASIPISFTVTFMFHSFFFLAKSRYLSLFSLTFNFTLSSPGTAKSPIQQVLFFPLYWVSLGLIVCPRLGDPFVSQNPREVCPSHSQGQILGYEYNYHYYSCLCIYHLLVWSNLNSFHDSE